MIRTTNGSRSALDWEGVGLPEAPSAPKPCRSRA